MLLSMYASYHLAKFNRRVYIPTMVSLAILISCLSTFFTISPIYVTGFLPTFFLSFPFFHHQEQYIVGLEWGRTYITESNIHFLDMRILTMPAQDAFLFVFLFLLLINLFGAVFGYWVYRRLSGRLFERKIFDFFCRSLFVSFIFSLFIFYATPLFLFGGFLLYVCIPFLWIPAAIATAIYGIHLFKKEKMHTF